MEGHLTSKMPPYGYRQFLDPVPTQLEKLYTANQNQSMFQCQFHVGGVTIVNLIEKTKKNI